MNPGRELDALVAEKVMGWKKIIREGNGIQWVPPYGPPEMNIHGFHPPAYSTDIAAAWEIVEKFLKDPPGNSKFIHYIPIDYFGEWKVIIQSQVDIDVRVAGFGKTAPHAICLAALKAVGYVPDLTK